MTAHLPRTAGLALACLLVLAPAAGAARTVYFADPGADAIAQFSAGPGGELSPLGQAEADDPHRLAMTSGGLDLYATGDDGVLQYDVAADGRLTPKAEHVAPAGGWLHSIAVRPGDASVYVTDAARGKVRQYDVGPGGQLSAKEPAYVRSGPCTRGVAVSPGGDTVYVLVAGGIVLFDVGPGGALTRRDGRVEVPSWSLEDVALTPDGANLFATSRDGRVFQFAIDATGTPVAATPAALGTGSGTRPAGIAVAPDGAAVYVTAGRAWPWSSAPARQVLAFAVGPDGLLTPAGSAGLTGGGFKVGYASASPDGRSLFAGGGDGHLFDLAPGPLVSPKASPSVDLDAARGVVVSPNQAPVARFVTAAPGVAGSPTRFDASTAIDPDGAIVRYDWDFGDGTLLPDGGPAPEHVYASPGTYTVTLVVTDNEGASTATVFTGGTVLGNGSPGAQATQQIEVAAPPEPPPPPGPEPAQEPLPDLGETLVAEPLSGTVRIREPDSRRFVRLDSIEELPLGSTLDTRRGRVEIATERRRRSGRVQRGVFRDGVFTVRQRRRDRFVTELALRGVLDGCPSGRAGAAAKRQRRLWGNAKGRFRTRGRYSSGAVRGTSWLTVDRCDGTLTVVREGRVAVRDFGLRRTFVLAAGRRHLARPR